MADYGWLSGAVRYNYDGQAGIIGPVDEEFEKAAFATYTGAGSHFHTLQGIEAKIEGPEPIKPITTFARSKIHPILLNTITKLMKYETPTPVQAYCMAAITADKDVICISPTGSGKTAAYMIPILNDLFGRAGKHAGPHIEPGSDERVRAEPLVVVAGPTRELVIQIYEEARRLAYRSMLRICAIYGGAPLGAQIRELEKGCDILIATPGRLNDFMGRPKTLAMDRVRYTVIDEADEMLKADWENEIEKVFETADNSAFTLMSATFPGPTRALARKFLSDDHTKIRVGRAGATHGNIKQEFVWADDHNKRQALLEVLKGANIGQGRSLVFVNVKRNAELLDDYLHRSESGMRCGVLHGDLAQLEREQTMRRYHSGEINCLTVTGIAARGMDIPSVNLVVNYDLPSDIHGGINEYVNRIGRTGRMGFKGRAVSFFNDRNIDLAPDLTKLLKESKTEIPDFLEEYAPSTDIISDASDSEPEMSEGIINWGADQGDQAETTSATEDPWAESATETGADPWGATETTAGDAW